MRDYARMFSRLVPVLVLTLTLICSFAYLTPGNRLRAVSAQSMTPSGSFGLGAARSVNLPTRRMR